ncbi:TPA: glycerol-3-phosphate 1-O-acyltransferase PlsY [Candidatus Poribacteria bacterium]|nr:glycerol-3-phosphate 1-O-acyltransferase PlsY [Candidatus Poribacteria bacterium]
MIWISLLLSYLIGAIPFGLIVTKGWKKVDVRRYGSGNIGFTNVLRVAGPIPGFITLALDILKAYISARFVSRLAGDVPYLTAACGVAAIVGHNWTVYLKFKGGKGIATTIGAFLALDPTLTLLGLGVWAVTVGLTRYVSLGSILFVCSLPVWVAIFGSVEGWSNRYTYMIVAAGVIAIMGLVRHISNIKRLINGTERKLGERVQTS